MSNAIEHGGATSVTIELAYQPQRFTLWIRDNGAGFSLAAGDTTAGGHFGLAGMRERAERSGGKLTVESAPGVGTEISVIIEKPKRREHLLT
jgi:signal transduction histidine kinase